MDKLKALRKHEAVEAKAYHCPIQGITITQEFDDYGNHRIVINDKHSHWTGYQFVSTLDNYRGCTDYYEGCFPHVFGVIEAMG